MIENAGEACLKRPLKELLEHLDGPCLLLSQGEEDDGVNLGGLTE